MACRSAGKLVEGAAHCFFFSPQVRVANGLRRHGLTISLGVRYVRRHRLGNHERAAQGTEAKSAHECLVLTEAKPRRRPVRLRAAGYFGGVICNEVRIC